MKCTHPLCLEFVGLLYSCGLVGGGAVGHDDDVLLLVLSCAVEGEVSVLSVGGEGRGVELCHYFISTTQTQLANNSL